jgi:NTP pyrophosphatase (non-canonical NTP hydrolase)
MFGKMSHEQWETMTAVMNQVGAERIRQNNKWGEQNHGPFVWLAILGEEVGEANKAALEACDLKTSQFSIEKLIEMREELVQVAAVAVAMIESLDRNEIRSLALRINASTFK